MGSHARFHLLLALTIVFWAGNALVGRATVGQVPPIALSFWRWAIALLIILPFTARDMIRVAPLIRARWQVVTVMAVASVTAYNTLLYLALQTTTAINATLVATSMPVMLLILSRVWLKTPIRLAQGLGIALSLAGVLFIIGRGDPARLMGLGLAAGDLLMLAAVLSWTIYSAMLRRYPLDVPGQTLLAVLIAIGTVFILPLYLWEIASGVTMEVTWTAATAILYTAVFPSLLAYTFWNKGVAALGAAVAGQYTYLMPLFTAVLAVALLGESFHWFHGLGGVMIFGGLWLATRQKK
ncbi:hypothetical protein A6A04_10115 [Paramagnetospirillum marisnigri]|uniref:EamA domain-containing protein n=1 Tax=Paramagnetospirillum marisnigri TaxID=1285242 RepID=A0A178M453_9PROT|nr:DMT family transporter [Paramagnetospirillum marisnigri]OAN43039.1 hypothetical protein A6A04_10115 [Paramagnetospirillum marisnigri]